ncbi:MAG: hypothetical protein IPK81_03220 [Rhodospirillales bacterium]|nr:MAG: hypothetical protein IPK81_03220 [Rhodospirillales bacterium]
MLSKRVFAAVFAAALLSISSASHAADPGDGPAALTAETRPVAAAPGPPPARDFRRVRAGRGETCSQYVRWCVDWCTANMTGSPGCLSGCKTRGDTCQTTREWVVENEAKIVTHLPLR